MPPVEVLYAAGLVQVICACWATQITVRFGGVWFVGFFLGAVLGPFGVLITRAGMGRICWHCFSRIPINARVCHDCQGDVVERRKGRASRTGFGGRKREPKMRQPTDQAAGKQAAEKQPATAG